LEFFDKKQEVMETVLTPHGRKLFMQGKLNPAYYAFFDDDIIYDGKYGNSDGSVLPLTENQNDIEGRIQEDTPRIKPIKTRRSVEEDVEFFSKRVVVDGALEYEVKDITPELRASYEAIGETLPGQPQEDKLYSLKNALATGDPYSSNYPAWDVEFMQAQMTGSFTTFLKVTGTFVHPQTETEETRITQFENIPQLEVEGKYITHILDLEPDDINEYELPETRVVIEEDFILMKAEEKNAEFLLKNFDIELFRVEETHGTTGKKEEERLIPLIFQDQVKNVIDPSLIVENYFDIFFDENIPKQIICSYINDKAQGVFSDMLVECDELITEQETAIDIYSGLSDNPGEDC
tara:strand:+ start:177 stop:1223 length:1047 start_codon:yes stop_codon:yes gene_type:complete